MMKNLLITAMLTVTCISSVLAQNDDDAVRADELAEARQSLQEAAARVALLSSELSPARSQVFRFLKDGNRAMLGVSIASSSEDQRAGAQIQGVSPGGAAEKAGLETGDVILSINGQRLGDDGNAASQVLEMLSDLKPGDEVVIEFDRDNVIADTVVIAERRTPGLLAPIAPLAPNAPLPPGAALAHGKVVIDTDGLQVFEDFDIDFESFHDLSNLTGNAEAAAIFIGSNRFYSGLELVNLNNADLASYFDNANGLLVVDVPDDDFFPVDLRGGDVLQSIDGRVVDTSRQAFKILDTYETDETLIFNILRDGDSLDLQMTVPEKIEPSFSLSDKKLTEEMMEKLSAIKGINVLSDGENLLSGDLSTLLEEALINGLHLDFEENELLENGDVKVETIIIQESDATI